MFAEHGKNKKYNLDCPPNMSSLFYLYYIRKILFLTEEDDFNFRAKSYKLTKS